MVIGREGGGREGETRRMREISGARVSNASAASVVSARATTHRKRDIRRLAVARLVRGGTARPLISRRSLLSRAGLRYTGPCSHEQGYPIPVPAFTSRARLYRSLLSRAGLPHTGPCSHEQGYAIPAGRVRRHVTLFLGPRPEHREGKEGKWGGRFRRLSVVVPGWWFPWADNGRGSGARATRSGRFFMAKKRGGP